MTPTGHSGLITALRKSAACSILALGITGAALAQTAAPATTTTTTTTATTTAPGPAPADDTVQLGAFVVNGYASSLESSLLRPSGPPRTTSR
jgi:hypothetical protein